MKLFGFDQVWWQAIAEWLINFSAFLYGVGITIYFAADVELPLRIFALTANVLFSTLFLGIAVYIRRRNEQQA